MRFETWSRPALAFVLLALGAGMSPLCAESRMGNERHGEVRGEHRPNSTQAQAQHYVVLIAFDGFRWDYALQDGVTHLQALGKHGVWAPEGMLPSYPALGLPNQFTIVSGLYPGHHGLVADNFYDPERKAHFSADNPGDLSDGSWYGGMPLWSLAESQGMHSAVAGWPGSEAEIAGFRPTFAVRNCAGARAHECVQQVRKWLRLPAPERPHFIAVNFAEPGDVARRFGPDAPETKAAVQRTDEIAGQLKAELDATGLPVDLIVVSDRGMAKTDGAWVTLDQFTSLSGFVTEGPLLYGETEQQREHVYRQINHVSSLFVVYRRKDLPPELRMSLNARIGDPVVLPTGAYAIRAIGPGTGHAAAPPAGIDGLDPYTQPQTKAIFFAAGADIVPGKTVAPFENVNLYPWIAHMLGLKPPKSDGNLNILAGTLRDDGGAGPHEETNK